MNNRNKSHLRIPLYFKYVLIWILIEPSVAYAYIDPGSGSVIGTAILGFIAAISYTFRKYFYKLKRKIFGNKREVDQELDE